MCYNKSLKNQTDPELLKINTYLVIRNLRKRCIKNKYILLVVGDLTQ